MAVAPGGGSKGGGCLPNAEKDGGDPNMFHPRNKKPGGATGLWIQDRHLTFRATQ